MKKSIAILAVCATALSPILATPAYAVPVFDPPAEVVTAEMTSGCAAYLADLNSTQAPRVFIRVATDYVGNEVTVDTTPFSSVPVPGTEEPVGPQTGADAFGLTANLVNGQSPNIFVNNAKAVYAGGSTFDTLDTFATTIVHTYSCTPTELVPGEDEERQETQGECASRVAKLPTPVPGGFCLILSNRLDVTVPGEPTEEEATDLAMDFETAPVAGTATDTGTGFNPLPYTDPDSEVQAVVCVSPVKSTGLWKKVNRYDGECSRALYDQLNAAGTPSNSLPAS